MSHDKPPRRAWFTPLRLLAAPFTSFVSSSKKAAGIDLHRRTMGQIGHLGRTAFGRSEAPVNENLPADPELRFRALQETEGLSDEALTDMQRAARRVFLTYALLSILVGIGAVWLAAIGWRAHAAGLLGVLFICASKAVERAFYNWVLRSRRFGAFREWLSQSEEWWPR